MKQLWILAGGNGSGKSTFYEQYLRPQGLSFVNTDLIAKGTAITLRFPQKNVDRIASTEAQL
jgi:predicted ABC-type ATPase